MFEIDDEGIGEEIGDSETDAGETDHHGDTDTETETGGSIGCTASVDALTITDGTDPSAVECVTKVVGDLVIGPSISIVDLQMLTELREVGGTLYIAGNLGLTSLEGLENLEQVGWLHVRRNGALANLHGLESLESVNQISVINNDGLASLWGLPPGLNPDELDIAGNDDLTNLDGLPVLGTPNSGNPIDIQVEDHQSLVSVAGLAACCSTQSVVIELARNVALADLDGLEPFQRFDTLRLVDNRALSDVSGIDATEIGTFEVSYNYCSGGPDPVLEDFTGLEEMSSIKTLHIEWVASLDSFAGLGNMNDVSNLLVQNNAGLDWELVVDLIGQTGPTWFEDSCGGIGGPPCPPAEPCPTY